MNAQCFTKVLRFALSEMLNQMLQVDQAIVDGRGGKHEELLALGQVMHLPITRCGLFGAGVAKMVCLVHHNHIRVVFVILQLLHPMATTLKVGMVDDFEC